MNAPVMSDAAAFQAPRNFVDHLQYLAQTRPDDVALISVQARDGEVVEQAFSYRDFAQRVRALAAVLQRQFAKDDRVLILLENDEYYALAMFACFHAGVIAVPVFPPESASAQHLARLAGIAADARARGVLVTGAMQELAGAIAGMEQVVAVVVDQIDLAEQDNWRAHVPAQEDIAFLQYTSGSTSAPKGVMVTHACLMANEQAIREGLSVGAGDKFGVWSPLFHDMGLIGGLLQPFYSGIPCVLCSPRFFLERPLRWLQLISRHRVTISGGPDFAYRLCLDRIKDSQLEGLDLSSWRVAYTGAEPVRHDTMDAFVERYAGVGFDAGAVYPCYGLAEATLYVTGGRRGAGMQVQRFAPDALSRRLAVPLEQASGIALVGCGDVPSGHQVRIVDIDAGIVAQPGVIGEIWAAGPSIAAGYWQRPEETAQAFVEADGQRWLRTGDLGFWRQGELFVAGRLKDMIIVRGHNIYPQDIEQALEAEVEVLRKGRVAAFAVNLDGEEGIGVAAEVSRGLQKLVTPQALADTMAAVVSEQCGQAPQVVVLLNPGALPKTSSGKLQRGACRKGWAQATLDAYATFEQGCLVQSSGGAALTPAGIAAPADDTTRALVVLWRDVLRHDEAREYAADAHFFAQGGNSLAAVQLAARIARQWQIDFPPRQVFEQPRLQQQAALIQAGLQGATRTTSVGIARLADVQRQEAQPLSPAQQRQWFLWQLSPDSSAYHVQGALRISGALDAVAMQQAFAELMQRHESMRTVFLAGADGVVVQRVQDAPAPQLEYLQVSAASVEQRQAQAIDILRQRQAQPFDLTRGPLVRASLLRIDEQVHLLALAMHHIVSDGASMQILLDELSLLYAGKTAAASSTLPTLAVQYLDYAAWQQAQANAPANLQANAAALAYWRRHLAVPAGQAQPVLTLPTDHPRPVVARYHAAQHHFELPGELIAALRQQAQHTGTTLFTLLLTAFQALLYRHTGQHDIRIGVPAANRSQPELLGVVGFFVNTLVLQARLDGRRSFADLLEQAKQTALNAQIHQALPFEQLVEALQPERSLTHSVLFQVMFNHLQEGYAEFAQRTGCEVETLHLPDQEAQFELTLDTREHPDGRVTAVLTYARELFLPQRIGRMTGHYLAALQALAGQPQQAIGEFAMLQPEEQQQLQQWLCNPQRYPDDQPVHVHIQQQAQQRPQATALMLDQQQLSYAQLEQRANQLAHHLISMGVVPEQRVGLALDRSLDMVVALLAILKAGGAFVPLDPHYPQERLAAMIEDSRIALALTHSHVRQQLPEVAGLRLLELDLLDCTQQPEQAPAVPLSGQHLAYVIYTSGSTGRPKGVAVAHHALAEHAQLSAAFSSLTPADRMLQFATLNFDGFIEQLFPPLLVGATVVLRGPTLWAPQEFLDTVRQQRVSIADLPTAYWFALIQSFAQQGQRDYGDLREIHIGGEAMAPEAIAVWQQAGLTGVRLLNTYGPTEAIVVAALLDCSDYVQGRRSVPSHMPIGRPLAGRSLHVLDENLQALPVGVPGELYIGGTLLARGYLERPALSAERFVADPFSNDGGRLYRSGDLVRWNADGNLEYLGRIDHQVKVRGFRVEPGEIEAQLLAQPEVKEAVVVAQAGRLSAYVSLHAAQATDGAALRNRLLQQLPDYMVPGVVMVLDAMPLNPNGKIDRRALPAPVSASRAGFEAPAGEMETVLAALWGELLGLEQVSRSDNFFELGGHSLLLLLAHERIKALPLPAASVIPAVVDLFRYPTISSLAQFMTAGAARAQDDSQAAQQVAQQAGARAARQRQAFLPRRKQTAGADL